MAEKPKRTAKQKVLFIAGLLAMLAGCGILAVLGGKRIAWRIKKAKLMRENTALFIPALSIKAPVLEGVEQDVLRVAAGHFPETGTVGSGNYCIAGHSSAIYKEYFNNLKQAENGMEVQLREPGQDPVSYYITDMFIVEPNETWILGDFGDTRVTIVTCTDDGSQRRIVVAKPADEAESPAETTTA